MGNIAAHGVGSAERGDEILIVGDGRTGKGYGKNKSSKVLRTDSWRDNIVDMEKDYIEFSDYGSAIG